MILKKAAKSQPCPSKSGTAALINRSEIDMQIATAHKFPRSIKRFRQEALAMVTLNEQIAESCIYALPRGNKTIEGPSARFAEVVASAWGNCRAGARVVSDQETSSPPKASFTILNATLPLPTRCSAASLIAVVAATTTT